MELKDRFDNPIMRRDLGRNEIEETKEQCAEIAENYVKEVLEWLTNEESEFSIMYGNQYKRFSSNDKDYTIDEIIKIFETRHNYIKKHTYSKIEKL
jgi:hypothetical protein